MIKIFSVTLASMILIFNSPNAIADDCSLSINSKESILCLQRKISNLENKLKKIKSSKATFPKDTVIDFKAKTCPSGWVRYQAEQNSIVNLKVGNLVKCQKV